MAIIVGLALVVLGLAVGFIITWAFGVGASLTLFIGLLLVIAGGIVMLIIAFLLANLFGFIASYRLHKSRRQQFVLLRNERNTKKNLESALSEVKTLRGIIPICSVCRKIRNDEGYYESVEQYLKRHSGADFSHTLCPDCLSEQLGEVGRIPEMTAVPNGDREKK